MSRLEELRTKYGFGKGGKYEPKPDCKFCNGTGERMANTIPPRLMFCVCLFVEPELSDFAGDSLAATAKKLREELDQSRERQSQPGGGRNVSNGKRRESAARC